MQQSLQNHCLGSSDRAQSQTDYILAVALSGIPKAFTECKRIVVDDFDRGHRVRRQFAGCHGARSQFGAALSD